MIDSPLILQLAKARLTAQNFVPTSPGCITQTGEVALCFAAALTVAAVEVFEGKAAAGACARKLAASGSKLAVIALGKKQGLSEDICREALLENDECPNKTRREDILEEIDRWQSRNLFASSAQ
jgi:hypothetical protein